MGGVELVSVREGVGAKVLVYVSNLRLLGCFLLFFLVGVVVLVLVVLVTGEKQSQLLV